MFLQKFAKKGRYFCKNDEGLEIGVGGRGVLAVLVKCPGRGPNHTTLLARPCPSPNQAL